MTRLPRTGCRAIPGGGAPALALGTASGAAFQLDPRFVDEEQFMPISFAEHWAVIRQVDEAMGVSYECQ